MNDVLRRVKSKMAQKQFKIEDTKRAKVNWGTWFMIVVLSMVVVAVGATNASAVPATFDQPNIVVILIDDLGWADLSCYGSTYHETPNIDRLAARGVRFTNGYAACSVCSPSRAALLTGNYPARIGITDWMRFRFNGEFPPGFDRPLGYESVGKPFETPRNPFWMELSQVTLAEALGPASYVSGHVGKWHLGPDEYYPRRQGFDINIAGCDYGQPPSYFFPYRNKWQGSIAHLDGGEEGEYLTDRLAIEAGKFIERHRGQRFFLHFAPYSVHTPIQPRKDLLAKYEAKPKTNQKNPGYAAMVQSVDDAVGTVLAKLDEMKLTDKTVVIFTSDNGGYLKVTDNAPLRGGKGMPFEGGLRVPFIVDWPGVTEAGTVIDEPVIGVDIFPTVLDIVGVEHDPDARVDGVSLTPLLADDGEVDRAAIYWHFPHYRGTDADPYGVVRAGDFKLIRQYEDGATQLYNLKKDLAETTDLAEAMPEKVRELDLMLSKWLVSANAKMPRKDPEFKASKPTDAKDK